jgi:hypothetical protein
LKWKALNALVVGTHSRGIRLVPLSLQHSPQTKATPWSHDFDQGMIFVNVAYGASQKTDRIYSQEFRISKSEHAASYASAGLNHDTKFDLRNVLELPLKDAYFSVPPHAPQG